MEAHNNDYGNNDYGIIDIDDEDFERSLLNLVKIHGVVVIKNVIGNMECNQYMDSIVNEICKVSDVSKEKIQESWKKEKLPQQVRSGMFHELICNTPTINKIRFNSNIIKIFLTYYSSLYKKEYNDVDLIVSNDGINIKPGNIPPYHKGSDWAHLDQSDDYSHPYKCIQGQMILTNTTAGFRASPKSHLLFEKFLTQQTNTSKVGGFYKFDVEQYPHMQYDIEKIGGRWQIPIIAKKGDFIIWSSSTIHSAMLQKKQNCRLDMINGMDGEV